MATWEGTDRRKFPRVIYPCMVKVISAQGVQPPILTHTENIGQGGVCLTVKNEIKLFTDVEVEIDLLGIDKHIYPKGKVIWVVRRKAIETVKPLFYDIGIEFSEIAKPDQEYLRQTLQLLIDKGTPLSKPYI
jgi:hypothetical protein